jgi:hypothetical protein
VDLRDRSDSMGIDFTLLLATFLWHAGHKMLTLKPLSCGDATRIREFLKASHYDEAHIKEISPMAIPPSLRSCDLASYDDRLGAWSPFHCLAKWFFLGCPVPSDLALEMVPHWFVALCVESGMLEYSDASIVPLALMVPCECVWITSDLHQQRRSDGADDHILPLNRPARHLCHFLIREAVDDGLDLCSGNGLHAMILGSFCSKVSTTDLSERSAMFCQFNAALNGRPLFDSFAGDRFESVKGREFDRIVCNPPFVITPIGELKFHANGLELDDFCRQLIQEVPRYLREGGYCQMLCEWVQLPDQSWQDRLAGWFDGLGCDVWIIRANTQFPETYVRTRALDAELSEEAEASRQEGWLAYLQEREVRAIHGGILTIRRRSDDRHWIRVDELEDSVSEPIGAEMLEIIAAEDFLHGVGSIENMLERRLRVSSSARLEQKSAWSGASWNSVSAVLRTSHGLTAPLAVDSAVLSFLENCQGSATLRENLVSFAQTVNVAPDAVQRQFLGMAQELVRRGLLLPV